jgi:hypothetical protein
MINKKSKKQKAIENKRTPETLKTQLEDLFAHTFKMGFNFDDDIQQCGFSLADLFQKFCLSDFDSEQHTKAIVDGRKKYNGSGTPDLNIEELLKLHFEREMLEQWELNGIHYKAVQLNGVRTSNKTGKPCDLYFIFLYNKYGRPIDKQGWVVKDYPQDRDIYHRYEREKRLASIKRFRCDK